MKEVIRERISSLREVLRREGIDAFIIPSTDAHMSEYVAPHWESRQWISGFTGSAGTVVVTLHKAGLWTDSRYFIQAADQLDGTGIDLYKEMLPETPDIQTFLTRNLPQGSTVGIDGSVYATTEVEVLKDRLAAKNIKVKTNLDPLNEIWPDRPPMPQNPAVIYDLKYAGKSCKEKLEAIRTELRKMRCESILLTALDEIAWTLNLRGNDVKCNPVVVSYLFISQAEAVYFIDAKKVTPQVMAYLNEQQVSIRPYDAVKEFLKNCTAESILVNRSKTNHAVFTAIGAATRKVCTASPVALLKAVRNEQEIAGLRNAMHKDGVAMVKFLCWLEKVVPTEKETELSVAEKLRSLRAEQDLFMGESFDTIAGYGPHAAIVHYSATPQTNAVIRPKGFLLLDSGAQYLDGTTDITRTIALGELTDEERLDYTLVLKGHITLAMAKFPVGTRGAQLDVLARMPLWTNGMNFLHGTGHGVGHFLSVHEGPQSIRMNENPVPLQPGMLTSNEPGVYKAGKHGVRIENLLLVTEGESGMYGTYHGFEVMTLCPIDTTPIVRDVLTGQECAWLIAYNRNVLEELYSELTQEERIWLGKRCDSFRVW